MVCAYLAVFISFLALNPVICQNFDYTDIGFEDPLAFLWNNRNSLLQDKSAPCTISDTVGGESEGTCKNTVDCKFNRGRSAGQGSCGLFNTCCIYQKTCNQTTKARVSYFRSPSNPRLYNERCQFRVQLLNENICQIRIDFINMQLTVPQEVATTTAAVVQYKCTIDSFFVTPTQRDVPDICGINTADSHIYIHLDPTNLNEKSITLNVLLAALGTAGAIDNPNWNIKVTQLECPGRKNKDHYEHHSNKNQVATDYNLLAPDGCLQYYTKTSGTVKSFNWGTAVSTRGYSTGQDYGICFKRQENYCGVALNVTDLLVRNPTNCADYLFVPERIDATNMDKICALVPVEPATMPPTFLPIMTSSVHPGPLYVHWHAQNTAPAGQNADAFGYGFQFQYNTKVACPATV